MLGRLVLMFTVAISRSEQVYAVCVYSQTQCLLLSKVCCAVKVWSEVPNKGPLGLVLHQAPAFYLDIYTASVYTD